MPRILFVGPRRDFSIRPFDGLVLRHQRLIESLSGQGTLFAIAIGSEAEDMPRGQLSLTGVTDIQPPQLPSSARGKRVIRLTSALPRRPPATWAAHLTEIVTRISPQVVVSLGPWLDEELSPIFAEWPCIHLFEEELSRMPDIAPQSLQAQLLRVGELMVRRHRLASPQTVVVISEAEIQDARRRFGSSARVVIVPYTLPPTAWKAYSDRSHGDTALSIGNFAEGRNAESLADFVTILGNRADRPSELQLVLISGPGFHPSLTAAVASHGWVTLIAGAEDLVEYYRTSRVTLVPAGRATGFKTTILQGWLCGTPVIASSASARTVEIRNQGAVAVAESPMEMVNLLIDLWDNDAELDRLAAGGRSAAENDHKDDDVMSQWRELVLNGASEKSVP
jgi:glycosyltransferase involved in cell wall biosynthesis